MKDCQICGVALATDEVDPVFTTILAHLGTPNPQLRVVTMGLCENCVTSQAEAPTAANSGGTSLGAQVNLWSVLAHPTLSVFQIDITLDVHVI